ncbi:MAG: carboxypeptidase regulatory-like domain-containing protein, partial [Armatimonadota bacterium]
AQTDGLYLYDLTIDSDGDGIPNWKESPEPSPDPARSHIAPSNPSAYLNLAVGGRWVAWMDFSGSSSVMYVYDRDLSQAFPFLTGIALGGGPSISGDTIVWSDTSSGVNQVYAYDLGLDSNGNGIPNWRESSRPSPDPALRHLSVTSAAQYSPTVSGDLVLWTDERYGGQDIMLYDLASSTLTELTHDTYPQWAIHVANGVAAWTDGRSGTTDDVYVWGDPSEWASLSGTVLDAHTGLALPGATVTDGEIVRTSLANGTYNMPVVPSGPQTVQAAAAGYLTSSVDITLTPGEQRTLNLPLVPASYGGIMGIVTDSGTALPVAGATLTCGSATATSDAGGLYVLAVTPGTGLTVSVTGSGYQPKSVPGISVTVGQTVALDIALDPLPKGAIAGTVRAADTLASVGGATVACGALTTATALDGTYTLSNVPEGGGYSVTATAPGFYANGQPGVSVTGGQITVVDITLPPIVGSVAGTVSDATTKLPIGGATVACGSATATTNARGEYGLPGVRIGGGYTVTASAPDHTLGSASGIAVAEKATTKVDFALTSTASGSIGGKVTDAANGAPIQNAHVTCGALSATTAADGTYALTNVPVGDGYRVGASAGGYKWGTATGVSIVSGQTASQDFALTQLPFTTGPQFEEILSGAIPSAVGVGWGDYDGDGYPDLLVAGATAATGVPVPHGPLLYHNNHDLTFAEAGQTLNLPADAIEEDGVAWGDYNNDGNLDLLLGSGAGYPLLYRRDPGQFVEVGDTAGFHVSFSAGRGVTWCDYNGDGLLDAFCSNIFGPGYLMKNNGDGTFTEVSAASGLTPCDAAQSASWGDYNNDGHPSLVIARMGKPTLLFRNNGDGTFTDVSNASGVSAAVDAFSAVWGDYDNDGWLDLYITSGNYINPQLRRDALFHNNHDGTFT